MSKMVCIEIVKPMNLQDPPEGLPKGYMAAGSVHIVPEYVAERLIEAGEAKRGSRRALSIAPRPVDDEVEIDFDESADDELETDPDVETAPRKGRGRRKNA